MKKIKMILRRVDWFNALQMIAATIAVGIILKDAFMMTIYSFITGQSIGLDYYGMLVWVICFGVITNFVNTLDEEPRHAKKEI